MDGGTTGARVRRQLRERARSARVTSRREGRRLLRRTSLDTVTLAVVAGLAGTGVLILQGTNAAFTAQTSNPGDTWGAGTVVLTDDDQAAAMINVGPLVPGATGNRCITVTYGGTLGTQVKLYATTPTGTLAPDVDLVVEQGTGGSFADCTGFDGVHATQLYSGTLAGFAAASSSYASGVGAWAPNGAGQARTYRFTWTLDPATPNGRQGAGASVGFVWESQS